MLRKEGDFWNGVLDLSDTFVGACSGKKGTFGMGS